MTDTITTDKRYRRFSHQEVADFVHLNLRGYQAKWLGVACGISAGWLSIYVIADGSVHYAQALAGSLIMSLACVGGAAIGWPKRSLELQEQYLKRLSQVPESVRVVETVSNGRQRERLALTIPKPNGSYIPYTYESPDLLKFWLKQVAAGESSLSRDAAKDAINMTPEDWKDFTDLIAVTDLVSDRKTRGGGLILTDEAKETFLEW